MLNYIIAGVIILVWIWIAFGYAWDPKYSIWTNLFYGLITILLMGAIHWIPFWLMFLK